MDRNRFSAVLLGAALLLGGCDFFDSALLPSLCGESSSSAAQPASSSPNTTQVNGIRTQVFLPPANTPGAAPQLGTGNFQPQGVTPGQPTGTAVGCADTGDTVRLDRVRPLVKAQARCRRTTLANRHTVAAATRTAGRRLIQPEISEIGRPQV